MPHAASPDDPAAAAAGAGRSPRHRRREALLTTRTVAFDDQRGVFILQARHKLRPPPLEQVHTWRRYQLLRDYLDTHGHPRPPVVWQRESLLQRLARLRRRREARKALQDAGCTVLVGSISL